MYSPVFLG